MDKTLLISSADRQIRAALLEGQELIEFFIDQETSVSLVGNIYRGTIEDIVPGLEAAFVNIGMERKAFLHFADLIPESLEIGKRKKVFTEQVAAQMEAIKGGAAPSPTAPAARGHRGRKGGHPRHNGGPQTDWAKILTPRTPAMVQVMKDGFGEKAPRITTNISLPGRLMVLLPFPTQSGGISKKISSPQERQRLKRILKALGSKTASFIIRTAGMTATDEELEKDATELKRQWQTILRRYRASKSEKLLLDDQNIYLRLARDVLSADVTRIIVDDPQAAKDMKSALEYVFPDKAALVTEYKEELPLFDKFDVTKMVRRAVAPKVWLRKGGQIVIDETEALTTIDINSGRFISKENQEKTILDTNLEACRSIAQHIRLRDLSGIIIIDFIDMLQESSRGKVEAELRRWLRRDRAKMAIGGFSDFGIFLLTRKRRRTSLMQQMTQPCPYCEGSGRLMSKIEIWRNIKQGMMQAALAIKKRRDQPLVALMVHPQMVAYVRERFEDVLEYWKKDMGAGDILIVPVDDYHLEEYHIQVLDKKSSASAALQLKARPRLEPPTGAALPSAPPPPPQPQQKSGGQPAKPPHRHDKTERPRPHDRRDDRRDVKREERVAARPTGEPHKPEPPVVPDFVSEEKELDVELDVIADTEAMTGEGGATENAEAPEAEVPDREAAGGEEPEAPEPDVAPVTEAAPAQAPSGAAAPTQGEKSRKRRRGRRGGRGRRKNRNGGPIGSPESTGAPAAASSLQTPATSAAPAEPAAAAPPAAEPDPPSPDTTPEPKPATAKKSAGAAKRGRRGGRSRKKPATGA